jgi:hypothetical protein
VKYAWLILAIVSKINEGLKSMLILTF